VWQKALGKKGWLAYTWPKKYGGPGWDVTQRFLFENVLAEEGAPRILPFGPKMVGPVIYTFGTEAQKARFLPRIRELRDDFGCKVIPSPVPVPTWRRSRPGPNGRGTTMS
jgi:alkylation response protein AidB-like acyl-CoA dehydrogenase